MNQLCHRRKFLFVVAMNQLSRRRNTPAKGRPPRNLRVFIVTNQLCRRKPLVRFTVFVVTNQLCVETPVKSQPLRNHLCCR